MVTGCGAAYSNNTISTGGWHMETGCGDTSAIATGGSYVGLINGSHLHSTTWSQLSRDVQFEVTRMAQRGRRDTEMSATYLPSALDGHWMMRPSQRSK